MEGIMKNSLEQCLQHLRSIKAGDPLRAVYCIVPSLGYLRCLQRAVFDAGESFAGLHVMTFHGFVREAVDVALALSGTRYIGSLDQHAVFRDILHTAELLWCGDVREFRVVPDLLARALMKLRLDGDSALLSQVFGLLGDKGKDLAVINDVYEKHKADANLSDYPDIVHLFLADTDLLDINTDAAIILMPGVTEGLSTGETRCIEKLRESHDVITVEEDVSGASIDFFTAPYDTLEAREIAARILKLAALPEHRFEDMAVVCPDGHYLPLMAAELESSGVPFWAPGGVPAGLTGAAAVFEALVNLLSGDFDFQDIKCYLLRCGGVPWIERMEDERLSRLHVLRMARKHGAAAGYDTWLIHMERAMSDSDNTKEISTYDLDHISALQKLIQGLGEFRERAGASAGIKEHAKWTSVMMTHFLPEGKEKQRLMALVQQLFNSPGSAVMTGVEFCEYILGLAGGYRESAGVPEGSVYLTDRIDDGYFRHVFAPGLTDSAVPGMVRQDPVLTDSDIDIINSIRGFTLEKSSERQSRTVEGYRKWIGRAVVTWTGSAPGMDIMEGKAVFPTPLMFHIYTRAAGKPFSPENIREFLSSRSCRPGILSDSGAMPLNEWEYSLSSIFTDRKNAAHYMAADENSERIYRSEKAKWAEKDFNEYMGFTGHNEYSVTGHFSATASTKMVQCPYSYYLERVMKLKALDEPVPAEDIDAMQTGTLVHEILECFMKQVVNENISPENYSGVLNTVRDSVMDTFVENHELCFPVMWEKRRKEIQGYLENFLAFECENTNEPMEFELAFGIDEKPTAEITFGGMELSFSGKIDRIDKTENGYDIIDYKTSKKGQYMKGILNGGSRIQAFIYAEVLKKIYGADDAVIKAGFFPVKDATKPILTEYTDDIRKNIDIIFTFIREALEAGMFFPTGECGYCNFAPICGNHIGTQAERKLQGDNGLLAKYREIREME